MTFALISEAGLEGWRAAMVGWVLLGLRLGLGGLLGAVGASARACGAGDEGALKWSFPTDRGVWSSPTLGADGTVYVGSYDRKLYAICGTPPAPDPGARCSQTPDCPVGEYCDFSHRCYRCSYLTDKCDALGGDCCSAVFLHNCPSNPFGARCHPCETALVAMCNASRSNVFDCARCSGIHEEALKAAGCTNDEIARWCASGSRIIA